MIDFSLQKKLHAANGLMMLNVTCSIEDGEFISLYGASGAGKTSLLRMLAGFMKPDSGYIKVNDSIWYSKIEKINKPPQQRLAGFVFQDYALFPNMNVAENISFALPKNNDKKIVDNLLELTSLTGLKDKKVQTLSGGQQQRVALARALVRKPQLLLLDEPLAAIDSEMRESLQRTLQAVQALYKVSAILVSHDVSEIVKLTSKTIYIENGTVKKLAPSIEIFCDQNTEPSVLNGTFLSAEINNGKCIVTLLLNKGIIKIQVNNVDTKSLQKGDVVSISFKDAVGLLRKL